MSVWKRGIFDHSGGISKEMKKVIGPIGDLTAEPETQVRNAIGEGSEEAWEDLRNTDSHGLTAEFLKALKPE